MRRALFITAAAVAGTLVSAVARADALTRDESDRLENGATVARAQTVERGGRRYVGGVAYTVVDAPPTEFAALLDDVDGWRRFLPKTRSARRVGTDRGDALIEITHGTSLLQVTYTVRLHRDGSSVRFWIDPARSHDIEDVWGYFRATPIAGRRTLVSYGILIDMGPGLLRDLFEGQVRQAALAVPDRVRGLLLERRSAEREAASGPTLAAGARPRY
ncbi:MAG: SRPBCC family protein [Myxococcales bacterium]|nr:SRPBCC family protein [Myxococcales bacterium]